MSLTDACDMKKMGDGAHSSTTDVVRSSTTDDAGSSSTDDGHARDASAGCSVSACHMDRLPEELLQQVLSHLSLSQQLGAQLVSRRWQEAVHALLRCRQVLDTRTEMPDGCMPETLSRVLHMMPSLRVLRLMPSLGGLRTGIFCADPRSTATALDIIATHCKRLVEIDLYGSCINDDSLKRLYLASRSLEKVRIRNANESDVRVLLQHLPTLRTLELYDCYRVTGQCFSLLPASLRRLSVAWCHGLRSDALLHVGTRCPQLRELYMSKVVRLQLAHMSAALSGCPLLERLTARYLYAPLERCLPPAGLPGLRHLDVGCADGVTDSTLRLLPDLLPALQTLNIRYCDGLTEEGLLQVCRWKELVSLDLGWLDSVTDAVLDRLHELPLREIHLASGMTTSAFTEQGIVRLVLACQSLALLDVSEVRDTLTPAMVDQLLELLPPSRSVTLCVGDRVLASLPPLPPGPLRLQKWPKVTKVAKDKSDKKVAKLSRKRG